MVRKSIAQSQIFVEFWMLPVNRRRQLVQLDKLDPELFGEVAEAIRRFPGLSHDRRIARAMQQVLVGLTTAPRPVTARGS